MLKHRSRLVRLVSEEPLDSNVITEFTNTFTGLELNPYAEIALINATLPLDESVLTVDATNNQFRIKHIENSAYRTITIENGQYSATELAAEIQSKLDANVPYSARGMTYIVKQVAGKLRIYFFRSAEEELDPNEANTSFSMYYDANTGVWTVDKATSAGNGYNWVTGTPEAVLSDSSQSMSIGVENSVTGGGEVYMGTIIGNIEGPGDEILVDDDTEVIYGMKLSNTAAYTGYCEGTAYPVTGVVAQDGDVMRMRFDNSVTKVYFEVLRGGAVTGSTSAVYLDRPGTLYPYHGLSFQGQAESTVLTYMPYDIATEAKVSLEFPTESVRAFLGFRDTEVTATSDGENKGVFEAEGVLTNVGDLPSFMIELPDINLENYDGNVKNDGELGRRRNFLAIVPSVGYEDRVLTYEPPTPVYVSVNNRDPMPLSKIRVRFSEDGGKATSFLNKVSLLISVRD